MRNLTQKQDEVLFSRTLIRNLLLLVAMCASLFYIRSVFAHSVTFVLVGANCLDINTSGNTASCTTVAACTLFDGARAGVFVNVRSGLRCPNLTPVMSWKK